MIQSLTSKLPDGWAEMVAPNGRKYFVDHKRKLTIWQDPRIDLGS
jgi:hypothetical protein